MTGRFFRFVVIIVLALLAASVGQRYVTRLLPGDTARDRSRRAAISLTGAISSGEVRHLMLNLRSLLLWLGRWLTARAG
jgi:hypothetical protein